MMINRKIDGWMDGWMDGCIHTYIYTYIHRWMIVLFIHTYSICYKPVFKAQTCFIHS